LRASLANAGLRLDVSDLEALLQVMQARSPAELERQCARLRARLGPAAVVLEPHLQALHEQVEELQRARHLAATDPLTGLANRRAFGEAVRREMARSERSGTPLAVVMLDIDDFKAINDDFGHGTGDEVLRSVARCARHGTRQGDVVARLGGDELALLLPDADLSKAQAIGERIRAEIAGVRVDPSSSGRVGVSIGIGVTRGRELSLHGLLAAADRDLYRDKAERKAAGAAAAAISEPQHSAA
jgi:diguanylate cyclase (GGDEF)-like protein